MYNVHEVQVFNLNFNIGAGRNNGFGDLPEGDRSTVEGKVLETFPGFLRGYRTWNIRRTGALAAVWAAYTYTQGVNEATCGPSATGILSLATMRHEDVPRWGCSCGFYAAYKTVPYEYIGNPIWGSIKATGRILVGTRGFRAQKVEVEALCVNPGARYTLVEDAKRTGDHYGVPVFHDLDAMLAEFPPHDLQGILPDIPQSQWTQILGFRTIDGTLYSVLKDPYEAGGVLLGNDGSSVRLPPEHPVAMADFTVTTYRFLPDGQVLVQHVDAHVYLA
jgi:hypothetical protein